VGAIDVTERLRADGSRTSNLYRLRGRVKRAAPHDQEDQRQRQDQVLLSQASRAGAREGGVVNEPLPGLDDGWGPVEKVNRKPVTRHERELAGQIVDDFNAQAGTAVSVETHTNMTLIVGAIRDYPKLGLPHWRKVIARQLAAPWWEGPPQLRVIFSPKVLPMAIDQAREWDGGPVKRPVRRNGRPLTAFEKAQALVAEMEAREA
jgi:hypothetical protein